MAAGVGDARELEELREAVESFAKNRHVELWLFRAMELLLMLAVVFVVLR
jgi:hypothetical protein